MNIIWSFMYRKLSSKLAIPSFLYRRQRIYHYVRYIDWSWCYVLVIRGWTGCSRHLSQISDSQWANRLGDGLWERKQHQVREPNWSCSSVLLVLVPLQCITSPPKLTKISHVCLIDVLAAAVCWRHSHRTSETHSKADKNSLEWVLWVEPSTLNVFIKI